MPRKRMSIIEQITGVGLPDRITWAVLIFIFFNLLWLRYVDAYIPIWVGAIIAVIFGIWFVVFGPRPFQGVADEEEEGE